jgi:hypothetical protein
MGIKVLVAARMRSHKIFGHHTTIGDRSWRRARGKS